MPQPTGSDDPQVAIRFEDETRVNAVDLRDRLSRSVAATILGLDRAEIAAQMSAFLGTDVSVDMLNKYCSPSADHMISLERAIALIAVTDDPRIFGDALLRHDYAVIQKRYLAAVDEAMYTDEIEQLSRKKKRARQEWKGGS